VGDFNGDGRQDLATANSGSDSVSILLGNGSGRFGASSDFPAKSPSTAKALISIVTADFNQDGNPDLATINRTSPATLSILIGDGNGRFDQVKVLQIGNAVGTTNASIAIGDFNRDGKPDFVVSNKVGNEPFGFSIYLGDGAVNFANPTFFPVGQLSPQSIAFSVADFNGDGLQDIAITGSSESFPYAYPTLGTFLSVFIGDGAGRFAKTYDFIRPDDQIEFVSTIEVGDFNGDGKQDVVVPAGQHRRFFAGGGDGGFAPPASVSGFPATRSSAVEDFNGDRKLDLLEFATSGDRVYVHLGDGSGNFTRMSFACAFLVGDVPGGNCGR